LSYGAVPILFDMIQANLVSLTHLVLVDGLARM